jgi:hypothetical protein
MRISGRIVVVSWRSARWIDTSGSDNSVYTQRCSHVSTEHVFVYPVTGFTQGTLCCPSGTVDAPCKSTVRRVAAQLHRALSEKGLALLVNHGIPEDKVRGSGPTNEVVKGKVIPVLN